MPNILKYSLPILIALSACGLSDPILRQAHESLEQSQQNQAVKHFAAEELSKAQSAFVKLKEEWRKDKNSNTAQEALRESQIAQANLDKALEAFGSKPSDDNKFQLDFLRKQREARLNPEVEEAQ